MRTSYEWNCGCPRLRCSSRRSSCLAWQGPARVRGAFWSSLRTKDEVLMGVVTRALTAAGPTPSTCGGGAAGARLRARCWLAQQSVITRGSGGAQHRQLILRRLLLHVHLPQRSREVVMKTYRRQNGEHSGENAMNVRSLTRDGDESRRRATNATKFRPGTWVTRARTRVRPWPANSHRTSALRKHVANARGHLAVSDHCASALLRTVVATRPNRRPRRRGHRASVALPRYAGSDAAGRRSSRRRAPPFRPRSDAPVPSIGPRLRTAVAGHSAVGIGRHKARMSERRRRRQREFSSTGWD